MITATTESVVITGGSVISTRAKPVISTDPGLEDEDCTEADQAVMDKIEEDRRLRKLLLALARRCEEDPTGPHCSGR